MNDKPIRLSRWTHLMSRDGVFAIFHSLNLSLIFLEEKYKLLLEELRYGTTAENLRTHYDDADEILLELQEEQFVVSVNNDDEQMLHEKQQEYVLEPSLETLFILLTDTCNLRCRYCFINNNMPSCSPGSNMMTWETARQTVDMYFANLKLNRFRNRIVFYGGEPLLAFQLMKRIIEYIKTQYAEAFAEYKVGLLLINNGTKVTDEVAKYLAEHPEITIGISLDGCEEVHDIQRVYADGKGTFKDVETSILRLHAVGRKDINISATISEHNIDRLDDFLVLHKQYSFPSVSFNLLLDTAEQRVDASYTEKATIRMLEYFEKAREIGLYEDRIMRKIRAISNGRLHPFDCKATGAQLAISPDGSLGICHEGVGCKNFFFGKVSSDFVFADNPLIQEWGKRSPLTMPQCIDCPSLGLCGGGCAYSAYLRHGTIWSVDDKFCKHSLAVLDWLVWDVYRTL